MTHRGRRSRVLPLPMTLLAALWAGGAALAQEGSASQPSSAAEKARPVFADGQAQVVAAFTRDWIQHWLWVETEFDSDGDGKPDRVHVDVWRPKQTETEGLKVPVVYETSPYFAGIGSS